MSIEVNCNCGKSLKAPDAAAGKKGRCPGCGEVLAIPLRAQRAPSTTPAQAASSSVTVARPTSPTIDRQPLKSVAPAAHESAAPREKAPSNSAAPPIGGVSPGSVAPRTLNRPSALPAMLPHEGRGGSKREYIYSLLALALLPLAISIFDPPLSIESELVATVQEHPELIEKLKEVHDDEGLYSGLPEHRFRDAFLSHESKAHWLLGLLSAGAFFALVATAFPGAKIKRFPLLGVGLLTSTVGILLLIGVQFAAEYTQGRILVGRSVLMILFYIAKFIGFSYRCASDPSNGFLISFFGYTAGVGLCEELCKGLPLFFRIEHLDASTRDPSNNWRSACLWGLASGIGFGIAEGVMYSAQMYNGFAPGSTYAVRFLSCVALHAIWAGSVGITMFNRQKEIHAAENWYNLLFQLVLTISIAMTLHGLYDTLLKKDQDALAFFVALISFGWFAYQVESMRRSDPVVQKPRTPPISVRA
jgi:RsiW-degrading membrane proteinase PrsW (M82 family)